jgi:hypothetical protein
MMVGVAWLLVSIASFVIGFRGTPRVKFGRSGELYFTSAEQRTAGLACGCLAAIGAMIRLAPCFALLRSSYLVAEFRSVIGDWNLILLSFSVLLLLGGLRALKLWRASRSTNVGLVALAELSVAGIIVASNLLQIASSFFTLN